MIIEKQSKMSQSGIQSFEDEVQCQRCGGWFPREFIDNNICILCQHSLEVKNENHSGLYNKRGNLSF